jgi:hypothetical protein
MFLRYEAPEEVREEWREAGKSLPAVWRGTDNPGVLLWLLAVSEDMGQAKKGQARRLTAELMLRHKDRGSKILQYALEVLPEHTDPAGENFRRLVRIHHALTYAAGRTPEALLAWGVFNLLSPLAPGAYYALGNVPLFVVAEALKEPAMRPWGETPFHIPEEEDTEDGLMAFLAEGQACCELVRERTGGPR